MDVRHIRCYLWEIVLFVFTNVPLVVVVATGLHISWAACLIADDRSAAATAVSAMMWMPHFIAVVTLLVAGTMALFICCVKNRWLRALLMVPQQALLFLSAGVAIAAMWSGHFADGTIRPTAFITADQILPCLIAFAHMYIVIGEIV